MTDTATTAEIKNAVFDALTALGIHSVGVAFDGYGDSGQIESIEAFDGVKNSVSLPDNQAVQLSAGEATTLREAIETLAYACLEEAQPGWEINDGAFGTFVFAIPDRTITLDHNARFTNVATSQHSF